jgi:WD40 repeat protein
MKARLMASIAIAVVSLCLSGPLLVRAAPLSQTSVITQVQVVENANLRAGPGTSYDRVGGVKTGEILDVIDTNDSGDWYQLTSGYWIAASLVERVTVTDYSEEQLDFPEAADGNAGTTHVSEDTTIPDAHNPEKALNVTGFADLAEAETLRLGRGKITDVAVAPRSDYLAVATPLGTWIYALGSLDNGYLIAGTADSTSLSWSPEGSSIAIGQKDGTVSVVDATTYAVTDLYFVDDGSPVDVAWSPNSQYLASATDHDTIHVWDTLTNDEIARLEALIRGTITVMWLPDSVRLAASGIARLTRIWDVTTQTELDNSSFADLGEITSFALSPDGHNMAVATDGDGVSIMDVSSGAVLQTFRSSYMPVVAVGWLDDGVTLVSVDFEGHIDYWDTTALTYSRLDQTAMDGVNVAAFSSDRQLLVTCTHDGRIITWRLGENEPLAVITGHTDLHLVDWLPDGRNLLVHSYDMLEVVDSVTGRVDRTYDPPENYRRGIGVSNDGKYMAVTRVKDQIAIVDLTTMAIVQRLDMPGMDLLDIAWSPDGQHLIGADSRGSAYIWELSSGELVKSLAEVDSMVGTVAWSPDGQYFASGSTEEGVIVWDALTWEMLFSHETDDVPQNMEWSPDGTMLLIEGWLGQTEVLDVGSETMIPLAKGTRPLTWSPDGQALYVEETDGTISALCLGSWRSVASFYAESIGTNFDMKWSPLGGAFVIGAGDGTLRLFDAPDASCGVHN